MKSHIKAEAVATIGKYKDKLTGEEKKQYAKVGTLFESEDGRLSLKLDTIPIGPGWSGYIQFFPPKQREEQAPLPPGRSQPKGMPPAPDPRIDDEDDDLPF